MDEDDSLLQEAKALRDSIVMIRTAQGKSVPSEFPFASPGWHAAALLFAQDIDRLWSSEE